MCDLEPWMEGTAPKGPREGARGAEHRCVHSGQGFLQAMLPPV